MLNLYNWLFGQPNVMRMPDCSISPSDAARVLRQAGRERQRAKVRAMCREICAARGCPVPPALED